MAFGGPQQLLTSAVQGIAGGIGLVAESVHARQARSKAKKEALLRGDPDTSIDHGRALVDGKWLDQKDETQSRQDEEANELTTRSASDAEHKRETKLTLEAFLARHWTSQQVRFEPLALPVIVPQRRPRDRSRGFLRAYAPLLAPCGIDQASFLDFLDTFHHDSQANPWIQAINLASIATMFLPTAIGQAVSVAIKIASDVATEVHSRSRTNTFLNQVNDAFFRPRGLYCLIITYDPSNTSIHSTFDLTSTIASTAHASSDPSTLHKLHDQLRSSAGTTHSEMEFPECAPLIFPAIDERAVTNSAAAASSKNARFQEMSAFVDDYGDRRAQAKFSGQHPDSVLVQGPKATFSSRYADPNHPANSGHLLSLLTGGHINPPSLGAGRGAGFRTSKRGGGGGRGGGGAAAWEQGGMTSSSSPFDAISLKRILKKDIMYMLIVNMPSEQEMVDAATTVAMAQQRGGFASAAGVWP